MMSAAAVTFGGGGTLIAATESNGKVSLWELTRLASLRADPSVQACAITGRGLTETEWARYVPELRYQPTCSG